MEIESEDRGLKQQVKAGKIKAKTALTRLTKTAEKRGELAILQQSYTYRWLQRRAEAESHAKK